MAGIFTIAELKEENKFRKTTFETLGIGKIIAEKLNEELNTIIIGYNIAEQAAELTSYGAKKIYLVDSEKLKDYDTTAYTKIITEIVKKEAATCLIFGATVQGKDLSPRIAARLNTALCTDSTAIEIEDGSLIVTRPVYAGKAFLKVKPKVKPYIIQIRPNVFPAAQKDESQKGEVVKLDVTLTDEDIKSTLKERIITATGRPELTEADIIVSGGRGMKGSENYKIIEELADLLGAAVGASRAAVDAGWRPHSDQVGQTGKTVSPTLYIACGISGAIQHLAGMSSSKYIVAINKDPEAPIFNVCSYGVVGDLFKVVPALTQEIKKLKEE